MKIWDNIWDELLITIAVPNGPPMPFWIGSPKGDGLWLMYRITILHQRDTGPTILLCSHIFQKLCCRLTVGLIQDILHFRGQELTIL